MDFTFHETFTLLELSIPEISVPVDNSLRGTVAPQEGK